MALICWKREISPGGRVHDSCGCDSVTLLLRTWLIDSIRNSLNIQNLRSQEAILVVGNDQVPLPVYLYLKNLFIDKSLYKLKVLQSINVMVNMLGFWNLMVLQGVQTGRGECCRRRGSKSWSVAGLQESLWSMKKSGMEWTVLTTCKATCNETLA